MAVSMEPGHLLAFDLPSPHAASITREQVHHAQKESLGRRPQFGSSCTLVPQASSQRTTPTAPPAASSRLSLRIAGRSKTLGCRDAWTKARYSRAGSDWYVIKRSSDRRTSCSPAELRFHFHRYHEHGATQSPRLVAAGCSPSRYRPEACPRGVESRVQAEAGRAFDPCPANAGSHLPKVDFAILARGRQRGAVLTPDD